MLFDAIPGLLALLELAAGQGENPDEGGGVLIIAGSIVVMIAVVVGVLVLINRRTRG